MSKLVTGVFGSRLAAESAVEELAAQEIDRADISVLTSDATRGREFAMRSRTKAPEGAIVGVIIGALLGAVVVGLAAVGTLVVPALGLVATGPIVAMLAGVALGAALGGLVGGLVGSSLPEHEAKLIEQGARKGGVLVGVLTHESRTGDVTRLLRSVGAEHIKSASA